MLDVNFILKKVIKKEIFSTSELLNKAARQVIGELKTKYIDIKEEITAQIQYKILTKMLNDRLKTAEIYKNANRLDLEEKELNESNVIKSLLEDLEKDMPKQMTIDEIREKIKIIISSVDNCNIGIIMREFKDIPADKAVVSKLAKEMIN